MSVTTPKNPIRAVAEQGQSIWYDYIQRSMIWTGRLHHMAVEDGLKGVTSNPAIFEKAIGGSRDYAPALAAAVRSGLDAAGIFEAIAIQDIQLACDALRPVFEETNGRDGYVSLEVSPYLAHDTQGTVAEARRLWAAVGRDNVMIKVPATQEGLPAIETLISEGLNVNVTLLFAVSMYEQVFDAYQRGLQARSNRGLPLDHVASVASFFVSRIDTMIDAELEARIKTASEPEKKALEPLLGQAAICNAKIAYESYQARISKPGWKALAAQGARTQRLLWASTSTKSPRYRDVIYVEALIGPDTVNTVPEATYDAFKDHGRAEATLRTGLDEAKQKLAALEAAGVSLDRVTSHLLVDGVQKFADAFDQLLGTVERGRRALLGAQVAPMQLFGPDLAPSLEAWRKQGLGRRLWAKDARIFGRKDAHDPSVSGFMGWLDALEKASELRPALGRFQAWLRAEGIEHVVLMGMGGSSLAPDVFARVLPPVPGAPRLHVLDSTVPSQIARLEGSITLDKTVFVVSSKSGSTAEPNAFLAYFYDKLKDGRRFVAITDPGSSLEEVARTRGFRMVIHGVPEIGGRFSALSAFGLIAVAALGHDVDDFLRIAGRMMASCRASVPPAENPGLQLGLWLAENTKAGRDKLTLLASPKLEPLGAWLEQLVAESTGKEGQGVLPIDREPTPAEYGEDRMFAGFVWGSDPGADALRAELARLSAAGVPVARFELAEEAQLIQEMVRFQVATAVVGASLGINPFDQPNVEDSKRYTRSMLESYSKTQTLPSPEGERPLFESAAVVALSDAAGHSALSGRGSLGELIRAHVGRAGPGDYVAINAFVDMSAENDRQLQRIRRDLGRLGAFATTLGYGPRFLHSTGQLHKGDGNRGLFIEITQDDPKDLAIPGQNYGFSVLQRAQAYGDFSALAAGGRRVLRLHLRDPQTGLASIASALGASASTG